METKQALETALRDAMRSKNDVALRTIRQVMSAIKMAEIEKGKPLDEAGIVSAIQKEVKSRRETIADAEKANRPDLASASQSEIAVLEKFLPAQLSEAELVELVKNAVTETQAASIADMGKVMKALMPKVQGRAPGDMVNQIVRKVLAAAAG